MSLLEILLLLLIAGVCGAVGGAIVGISRRGCFLSIVVGFIGALLGRWLASTMGLPEWFTVEVGGTSFPILWSIIGSALFVALIGLMTRERKRA